MKLKRTKLLAGVLAMACLAACGGADAEPPYKAPQWALDITTPATTDVQTVAASAKVDVYYDNTQSMYGFSKGGSMVRAVTALRDVVNQYSNTTVYTLDGPAGTTLEWMPFSGDLRTALADYEGFYTASGKGTLAGRGPLQRLYYEDKVLDPSAINVVITDLAEQNVDTSELAARINENILSQEGYSAALIGIQGDFDGTKYVSDLDVINSTPGEQVNGKVPIYMLITGQDASLEVYLNNLVTAFQNYELVENQDYFVARYHAGNSARVLTKQDVLTVGAAKEQDGMRKSDWGTAEINQNLSLAEIDAAHLDTLIETSTYLNMFTYRYDTDANGVNTGRILLNYYLPIGRTDGLDLPVNVKIYAEDEQGTTTQQQELYQGKERIHYSELLVDSDVASAEELKAKNSAITDAYEITDEKGETSAVLGWQDIKQISRDKDLTISYELIPQGTEVPDMKLDAGKRDAEDLYQGEDLGVAAQSDVLHISVEFNKEPEERDGATVILSIPVYAMAESVENLPDWIVGWDSAGTQDYIYHTFGLENFFRTLFGLNVIGDETYNRALREVKIADIVTCVTDLPTA